MSGANTGCLPGFKSFLSGANCFTSTSCKKKMDVDGDGDVDIHDAIKVVSILQEKAEMAEQKAALLVQTLNAHVTNLIGYLTAVKTIYPDTADQIDAAIKVLQSITTISSAVIGVANQVVAVPVPKTAADITSSIQGIKATSLAVEGLLSVIKAAGGNVNVDPAQFAAVDAALDKIDALQKVVLAPSLGMTKM